MVIFWFQILNLDQGAHSAFAVGTKFGTNFYRCILYMYISISVTLDFTKLNISLFENGCTYFCTKVLYLIKEGSGSGQLQYKLHYWQQYNNR